MKKVRFLNTLILISILGLITIHVLVLFGLCPKELLWDTNIKDRISLVFTECVSLGFLSWLFIFTLKDTRRFNQTRNLIKLNRIHWILLIYSVLELFGSFQGINPLYKLFSIPVYLIILGIVSVDILIGSVNRPSIY